MKQCIIVDDEYLAITVIESFLQEYQEIKVVATFTEPLKALDFLKTNPIDLVFLDIMMPKITGLELIKNLPNKPQIILTTANANFALDAYNLDVLDYLVKPIAKARFQQALSKIQQEVQSAEGYITIKHNYKNTVIRYHEIELIEGMGEYVKIHTDNKNYMWLCSLKKMEADLPQSEFIRVHKSFLVAKSKIRSSSATEILLFSGKKIPVGRVYKDGLKTTFQL